MLIVGVSLIFVKTTELSLVGNVLVCDISLIEELIFGESVTVFSVGVVIDVVCMLSLIVVVVVDFVEISSVVVVVVAVDISFLFTVVSVPETDVVVVVCTFSETLAFIVVLLVLDSTIEGLVDTDKLDDVVFCPVDSITDAFSPLFSTFDVVICLFVVVNGDDNSAMFLVVVSTITGVDVSLPSVVSVVVVVNKMLVGVVSLLNFGSGGVMAVGKVTLNPLHVARV